MKNALKRNLALKFMPIPVNDVVAVNRVCYRLFELLTLLSTSYSACYLR